MITMMKRRGPLGKRNEKGTGKTKEQTRNAGKKQKKMKHHNRHYFKSAKYSIVPS